MKKFAAPVALPPSSNGADAGDKPKPKMPAAVLAALAKINARVAAKPTEEPAKKTDEATAKTDAPPAADAKPADEAGAPSTAGQTADAKPAAEKPAADAKPSEGAPQGVGPNELAAAAESAEKEEEAEEQAAAADKPPEPNVREVESQIASNGKENGKLMSPPEPMAVDQQSKPEGAAASAGPVPMDMS